MKIFDKLTSIQFSCCARPGEGHNSVNRGLWRLVQGVLSNRASFVVTQVRQGRKQVVWMLVGLPGLSPLVALSNQL